METAQPRAGDAPLQQVAASPTAKKGRKARGTEEIARFFLAKEGSSPQEPELGEEAQTESDALIKAFQQKTGVIYVVTAFRAEAEIQGGSPVLVKRPLTK
jgi:LAS superfamily LD-carboxypeptidase LdcB